MKTTRKFMAVMACLLLFCGILAGCGQQELSSNPSQTQPDGTTLPFTTGMSPFPTEPTSTAPAPAYFTLTVECKGEENAYYDETIMLAYDEDGNLLEYGTNYRIMSFTYDDMGNMTSKTIRNRGGKVQSQMDYFYDEAGRLVEISGFGYAEVYTTYKTLYFYDVDGNLTREEEYTNDELHFAMIYDANGNLLEGFSYIAGESHSVYTYSDDGKLLKVDTQKDGQPYSGTELFYDDRGNLLREERFLMSQGVRKELTNSYIYDANGRCIRIDFGGYQGEQKSEEYTYDDLGRMLSSIYTSDNGEVNALYWTYDENNNITSISSKGKNASNYAYTWSYDANGYVTSYIYDGNTYNLSYTWPDAEPSGKMRENILLMLYNFLSITSNTPENRARLYL